MTAAPAATASGFGRHVLRLDLALDVFATALIVVALVSAMRATRDLNAAGDADNFRDIAQAQTVRDGHPLTDPYYRGEWAWYNPLLAWTLAAGSYVSGTAVEPFEVHAGPWLNLLGPVGFYLLAAQLAGRRAAVASLVIYLFLLSGNERSWASATYSPWLFAANFAQGIFFLAVLALIRTDKDPTVGRGLMAGGLTGVTFLAHTAPALILAVMASVIFIRRWQTLLIIGLTAFVVASPFLVPLVVHYRLRIVHAMPVAYVYPPLSLTGMPDTLRRYALVIGLALVGLWRLRSKFAATWLLTSVALLAYTWAPTPPLLPGYHFWLYTTAVLALLAGGALAWLCPWPWVLAAAMTALVVWNWPAYSNRRDLQSARFYSQMRKPSHLTAAAFLRKVTQPDEIVAGSYGAVRLIIGPAGRKTLAPDPNFANPYRDFESRAADRDRMLAAVGTGDLKTLRTLATEYDVSAVVVTGVEECTAAMRFLPTSWRFDDVCILMLD